VEGSEEGTMDGETEIERALGSSQNAPLRRAPANIEESTETLRARLIAAVVEVLAQGSDPRLARTAHAPVAA
jgi:hypothetical protein